MKRSIPLNLERIEDRCVPAIFGLPWLSPDVTVSLAPDGTSVDGAKSTLNASLAADGLSATQWQGEIQRALQSWATATNLNFGFVADGGQAIGTTGRVQNDTRFGDIRVTARPLGKDVLAITVPPGFTSETRAGDIILNSDKHFGINPGASSGKYDLYTVFLQEIGHAVGVGNSTDAKSAMYETYQSTRTGLAATDATSAGKLYGGTRAADPFDAAKSNGSTSSASALPSFTGTTTLYARGDITTSGDVDVYSFTAPAQMPDGASVKLNVLGLSQLVAKVEILDSAGKVVESEQASDRASDVLVTSSDLIAGKKYFVRVTAPSGSNFRVGDYDLRVVFDSTAADPSAESAPNVAIDGGKNETAATATVLAPQAGTTAQTFYRTYGQIESSGDVDYYSIKAPTLAAGTTTTLSIQLASFNPTANTGGMANLITVYDQSGKSIPLEDLTYSSYRKSFQLKNVPSGANYTIAVKQNGFFADKNYELTAYFSSTAVNYGVSDTLTMSPTQDTVFRTLQVNTAQVFTLSINSQSVGSGAPTVVFLDVVDSTGKSIYTILGFPGVNYGSAIFLMPGEYTIRMRAPFSFSSAAPLQMLLRMDALTDPIGLAKPADPTVVPNPGIAPRPVVDAAFNLITNAASYYAWLV